MRGPIRQALTYACGKVLGCFTDVTGITVGTKISIQSFFYKNLFDKKVEAEIDPDV